METARRPEKLDVSRETLDDTRHWKDHFKNDLRSDQDHRLKTDQIKITSSQSAKKIYL
jgi:hypothetical protein